MARVEVDEEKHDYQQYASPTDAHDHLSGENGVVEIRAGVVVFLVRREERENRPGEQQHDFHEEQKHSEMQEMYDWFPWSRADDGAPGAEVSDGYLKHDGD